MGLLFVDGFDHYSTLSEKWDGPAQYAISALGRFSTNGVGSTDWGAYLGKSLTAIETVYVGFAINTVNGLPSRDISLLTLYDTGTIQCRFMIPTGTNFVRAYKGSTTTLLGTATAPIPMNGFHYIEFMAKIGSGDGEMHFKIDGVEVLTVTSADNRATSIDQVNSVRIGPNGSSGWSVTNYPLDDIYIADDAYKGDIRVMSRAPDGVGNYSQWDPSTGANWDCVNEAPPVTTDYVSTAVLDEIDTYTVADIATTPTSILAVVGNIYARKVDAGSRSLATVLRLSGTDLEATGKSVSSSWGILQFIQETKPGGGSWSVQNTKDAEMGVKLTA